MAKKILIVDDDPDLLLQLKLQLESAGYQVIEADGQKSAEKVLAESKPDMAILDLMMEDKDGGFILSHRIKAIDSSIPVIIVTAVTHETGLEFGVTSADDRTWIKADAILAKPVRFEQLKREIERLLKG
jgi:CheY-like chemotaxis protein